MAKFTPFGKVVKKKLIDLDKNSEWLRREIHEDTGLAVDSAYLSRILTGKNQTLSIINSICKILDIEQPQ